MHKTTNPGLIRTTPVKTYYCSTRRQAQVYNGQAKIDYAGNAGNTSNGSNGVVRQTTLGTIRMTDITDGTSATVLVGEKRLNIAGYGQTTDDNESYATPGWNGDWEVYRWGTEQPAQDFRNAGDVSTPSRVFGSAHGNGFNAVFCDGSVRTIRYSVSLTTWTRACVRNDNQVYSTNDL